MPRPDTIHPRWGVPYEEVSCPGCGKEYGYLKLRVCTECQECERCCDTRHRMNPCVTAGRFVDVDRFVMEVLGYEPGDFS